MADLKLQAVEKKFGQIQVIKDVNLKVESGEFVVFVGPSGCGKSTLLRMIAGLEDVTSGDIFIDQACVTDMKASARGIAMVFQSYALYPHMTVRENMSFGLEVAGETSALIEARVQEAAKILKLEALLDRKPKQLSGGQRQRVAIGRTIVRQPKVFLFDEPLSNLDAELRVQMRIEISRLHESLGNTMVYVTHDQVEAMTMADKIVVLREGVVAQVGTPLTLYHKPENKFVAGFIGSPKMNFLPTTVKELGRTTAVLSFEDGRSFSLSMASQALQTLVPGQKVEIGVRPEHLIPGTQGEIDLTLEVDVVERLGGATYVYGLSHGDLLIAQVEGDVAVEKGSTQTFSFNKNRVHVFLEDGQAISSLEISDKDV